MLFVPANFPARQTTITTTTHSSLFKIARRIIGSVGRKYISRGSLHEFPLVVVHPPRRACSCVHVLVYVSRRGGENCRKMHLPGRAVTRGGQGRGGKRKWFPRSLRFYGSSSSIMRRKSTIKPVSHRGKTTPFLKHCVHRSLRQKEREDR